MIDHANTENGIVHGFNRYAYANNNPYKFTDPDGEYAQAIFNPITVGVIATGCALSLVDVEGT